jgi:hypothetical protein
VSKCPLKIALVGDYGAALTVHQVIPQAIVLEVL